MTTTVIVGKIEEIYSVMEQSKCEICYAILTEKEILCESCTNSL